MALCIFVLTWKSVDCAKQKELPFKDPHTDKLIYYFDGASQVNSYENLRNWTQGYVTIEIIWHFLDNQDSDGKAKFHQFPIEKSLSIRTGFLEHWME